MMAMIVMAIAMIACGKSDLGSWHQLPSLPDKEGFAGCFAGVSYGSLLVAGGANFPDKKPWEGGKKAWYDTVLVLEHPRGKWAVAGKLPRPLGYGVSVTHGNSVICVGGSDANQHYDDTFCLEWKDGNLITKRLPSLPITLANSCGAIINSTMYVAGGLERPDSTNTQKRCFCMDLSDQHPQWKEIPPYPGRGRMLAVAAGFEDKFWLIGGVDLVTDQDGKIERRYLHDAYCYDPLAGWKRITDLPHPVVAAPSPAPTHLQGFYLLGGDDGTQTKVKPDAHPGFSKKILRYDSLLAKWSETGRMTASRVTVPCVYWNNAWVIPSGEVRPGIRSAEVWCVGSGNKE